VAETNDNLAPQYEELVDKELRTLYKGDCTLASLSWEELRTVWQDLDRLEQGALWGKALLMAAVDVKYGERAVEAFAEDMGISRSYAYKLRRTWMTFPKPNLRFPELSFSHHLLAAYTPNPDYWLETASLHDLSRGAMQAKIQRARIKTRAVMVETKEEPVPENKVVPESIPPNPRVALAPTVPSTLLPDERKRTREDLETEFMGLVSSLLEADYLLSDIIAAMKQVAERLRKGG